MTPEQNATRLVQLFTLKAPKFGVFLSPKIILEIAAIQAQAHLIEIVKLNTPEEEREFYLKTLTAIKNKYGR